MTSHRMRLAILAGSTAIVLAALPVFAADAGPTASAGAKTSADGITTIGRLVESQPVGKTDNGPGAMAKPAHEWPMPPTETKEIQDALNRNGAKLKVDGIFDQTTRKALRDYQSSHGLAVTGRPDLATLTKLKLA